MKKPLFLRKWLDFDNENWYNIFKSENNKFIFEQLGFWMAENTIPAVEKAVAVLTRLGESEGGLTQAELAAALDIAPSSCYRILQTLLEADWVCKIGGTA